MKAGPNCTPRSSNHCRRSAPSTRWRVGGEQGGQVPLRWFLFSVGRVQHRDGSPRAFPLVIGRPPRSRRHREPRQWQRRSPGSDRRAAASARSAHRGPRQPSPSTVRAAATPSRRTPLPASPGTSRTWWSLSHGNAAVPTSPCQAWRSGSSGNRTCSPSSGCTTTVRAPLCLVGPARWADEQPTVGPGRQRRVHQPPARIKQPRNPQRRRRSADPRGSRAARAAATVRAAGWPAPVPACRRRWRSAPPRGSAGGVGSARAKTR